MRKLVLWMQQSADGYASGPDGAFDWPVVTPGLQRYFAELGASVGAFLYGARVWQMMAGYWPTADENPLATQETVDYARVWRSMPKYVFSSTLQDADWGTTILRGDLSEEVDALRSAPGGDLVLFGGPTIAADAQRRDLVDEYVTFMHPVLLGGGAPLIPAMDDRRHLRLIDTRGFDGDVVLLRYERV